MEPHFTSARILIAGLGLIGGSAAKALRTAGCLHIDGLDTDADTIRAAVSGGIIDADFSGGCALYDIVICCLAPRLVLPALELVAPRLQPGGVFAEMSGLKTGIADKMGASLPAGCEALCLHPMAGSERSGYAHSSATLFRHAPLILTPTPRTGDAAYAWAEYLHQALGFGAMTVMDASAHDAAVANLSHLPHVAALAVHAVGRGNEALAGGSYRAITRVADINAPLWAGLLTDNAEYLLKSLAQLREKLDALETAVRTGDAKALEAVIRDMSVREDA